VKVNGAGFKDKLFLGQVLLEAEDLVSRAKAEEELILESVNRKISG